MHVTVIETRERYGNKRVTYTLWKIEQRKEQSNIPVFWAMKSTPHPQIPGYISEIHTDSRVVIQLQ